MGMAHPFGRVVAATCAATIGIWAVAAIAGGMSLTVVGVPAPIDVTGFAFNATNSTSAAGGVHGVQYGDVTFDAPESAASALQLLWTSENRNVTSAQLRVLSPVTAALKSEWTFSPILFSSFFINTAFDPTATTRGTTFSFSYGKIVYRVFAADGSVQSCFDSSSSVPC